MSVDTRTRRAGQSVVEYAVLITVAIGALVAMHIYLKRGIAGRLRSAADSLGEQYSPAHTDTDPADPVTLTVSSNTTTKAVLDQTRDVDQDGNADVVMQTTTTINNDTTRRRGTETVDSLSSESLW